MDLREYIEAQREWSSGTFGAGRRTVGIVDHIRLELAEVLAEPQRIYLDAMAAILTPACQADPLRGAQINLLGTLNVFETARARGIGKVLYMSSAGVFGPDDGQHPRPTTLYGAWKLAGEGIARAYFADHGIGIHRLAEDVSRKTQQAVTASIAQRGGRANAHQLPGRGTQAALQAADQARQVCALRAVEGVQLVHHHARQLVNPILRDEPGDHIVGLLRGGDDEPPPGPPGIKPSLD